jgi:O-antigen/teichoic acid export membrane protein
MLAVFPIVFKKMNDPDSKRFYSKLMTYFSFVVMIFALIVSIFNREIIMILTKNQEYWIAYEVIPIISLTIFFGMLKTLSLIGLHIIKKTKIIAVITVLMTVLNFGLNLLFVFLWKSLGAAFATLVSQIVFFIYIYKSAQRHYPIPFEIPKVLKVIIIGVILFISSLLLNDFVTLWKILLKSILIILFPILLYFIQFFEEIEILRIKQSWKKWRSLKSWKNLISK